VTWTTMKPIDTDVLIIGAGPAGAIAAAALLREGLRPLVVAARSAFSPRGAAVRTQRRAPLLRSGRARG